MRLAEARLKASSSIKSSMTLSFTGGQVGWMIKISRPRTSSLILTRVSPSEKRVTKSSPRGTPRDLAMFLARVGLAVPLKTFRPSNFADLELMVSFPRSFFLFFFFFFFFRGGGVPLWVFFFFYFFFFFKGFSPSFEDIVILI